jgi:phosphopantothenoylcysteine decarboxylase/phosphopantothenate--cysteine ligase
MKTKRLDLMVANDISAPGIGFQSDSNQVAIIKSEREIEQLPLLPKTEIADILLDRIRDAVKK